VEGRVCRNSSMRRQQMAKPRPLGRFSQLGSDVEVGRLEGGHLFAPVTSTRKVVWCSEASVSCWTCMLEVRW